METADELTGTAAEPEATPLDPLRPPILSPPDRPALAPPVQTPPSWLDRFQQVLRKLLQPRMPAGIEQAKLFILARTNMFGPGHNRARIVLIAGVASGAGTTMIAAALAEAMGKDLDGRVMLVDPRPDRSQLRHRLGASQIHPDPGATASNDVLLLRSKSNNFDVLQIPPSARDPEPVLYQYLRDCDRIYHYVIVDGGAIQGPWPDRIQHLSLCSLLVMDCQRTNLRLLTRVRKMLEARGLAFDGIIMNRQRQYIPSRLAETLA